MFGYLPGFPLAAGLIHSQPRLNVPVAAFTKGLRFVVWALIRVATFVTDDQRVHVPPCTTPPQNHLDDNWDTLPPVVSGATLYTYFDGVFVGQFKDARPPGTSPE